MVFWVGAGGEAVGVFTIMFFLEGGLEKFAGEEVVLLSFEGEEMVAVARSGSCLTITSVVSIHVPLGGVAGARPSVGELKLLVALDLLGRGSLNLLAALEIPGGMVVRGLELWLRDGLGLGVGIRLTKHTSREGTPQEQRRERENKLHRLLSRASGDRPTNEPFAPDDLADLWGTDTSRWRVQAPAAPPSCRCRSSSGPTPGR